MYSHGNSRADHALAHYGWPGDRQDDPHLCCVDEPGGDLWNCPEPGEGVVAKARNMSDKGVFMAARNPTPAFRFSAHPTHMCAHSSVSPHPGPQREKQRPRDWSSS
jgi:hypothetical protein